MKDIENDEVIGKLIANLMIDISINRLVNKALAQLLQDKGVATKEEIDKYMSQFASAQSEELLQKMIADLMTRLQKA